LGRNNSLKIRVILQILIALAALPTAAQSPSGFKLLEQQGPYGVGLRVIEQYDYSRSFRPPIDDLGRPYEGEPSRPLQTLVWYPAVQGIGKHLDYGDYVSLESTETSFGRPQLMIGMEARHLASMPTSTLTQTMWAIRDAQPASGKFPLIVYAPSFSSVSWENADLCEYLASFGYVVIATPAMGVHRESTQDVAGTNAQARDIAFLTSFAHSLPDVDPTKIAVIGYSWGGIANLFAAARDSRIKALVALDGSMRYYPGIVKEAGDVHPEQMSIPLLFFAGQHSIEEQSAREAQLNYGGPNVLNEWTHGDLLTVDMLGMIHPEFSSKAQRNEGLWQNEFTSLQEADYNRQDGVTGYAWVARYARAFLDAYLNQDTAAKTFLQKTPLENGVPAHTMAVHFRAAKDAPMSFDSFRAKVGQEGFAHVIEVYDRLAGADKHFHLDEDTVVAWALELLANKHFAEAVDVMQLAIRLDPSSSNFTNLGEIFVKSGNNERAIESYKRALEIDRGNTIASRALASLQNHLSR